MRSSSILILAGCLLYTCALYGQKQQNDSLQPKPGAGDTANTAEKLLLEHREQELIDSAIRRQLLLELSR